MPTIRAPPRTGKAIFYLNRPGEIPASVSPLRIFNTARAVGATRQNVSGRLRENLPHHFAGNIRKPEIPPAVTERELLVIEPNRCKIVA